jgi:hypothetical protein
VTMNKGGSSGIYEGCPYPSPARSVAFFRTSIPCKIQYTIYHIYPIISTKKRFPLKFPKSYDLE